MSNPLKLKAETDQDIEVLSASLQDAIGRVGDMHYDKISRSFNLKLTRFQHEQDTAARILTGVRIDGVIGVKFRGIERSDPDAMIVMLALLFTPKRPKPSGDLALVFAGGGEVLLHVECIDAIMVDVSTSRETDKRPLHPLSRDM